jgi:hypothetical protein
VRPRQHTRRETEWEPTIPDCIPVVGRDYYTTGENSFSLKNEIVSAGVDLSENECQGANGVIAMINSNAQTAFDLLLTIALIAIVVSLISF